MRQLKINIDKSLIPLIWVDTSIIINLAKIRAGKTINALLKKRMQYLYDIIRKATRNKQAICPRADQELEYQLGKKYKEECRCVQTDLSMGIRMKRGIEVEDFYMKLFMKAYIESASEINISYKDIFFSDPVEELNIKLNRGYFVDVELSPKKKTIDKQRQSKKESRRSLETLRRQNIANNITFQQGLAKEYRGTHDGYIEKLGIFYSRLKNRELIEDEEFLGMDAFLDYLDFWKTHNGKPPGFQGVCNFFLSDYQMQIPRIDIHCNLFAKILTSTTPIKSGDSMDLHQLSVVLPFFDLVITDRIMKYNIESLGYHKKYKTRVLALKDFDEIQKFLENLEIDRC